MNRIPVVNDEHRAGYGAPTTVVGATATDAVEEAVLAAVLAPAPAKKPVAKKPAPKKKPATKVKAKK